MCIKYNANPVSIQNLHYNSGHIFVLLDDFFIFTKAYVLSYKSRLFGILALKTQS